VDLSKVYAVEKKRVYKMISMLLMTTVIATASVMHLLF
jgi:hypothetical protein